MTREKYLYRTLHRTDQLSSKAGSMCELQLFKINFVEIAIINIGFSRSTTIIILLKYFANAHKGSLSMRKTVKKADNVRFGRPPP